MGSFPFLLAQRLKQRRLFSCYFLDEKDQIRTDSLDYLDPASPALSFSHIQKLLVLHFGDFIKVSAVSDARRTHYEEFVSSFVREIFYIPQAESPSRIHFWLILLIFPMYSNIADVNHAFEQLWKEMTIFYPTSDEVLIRFALLILIVGRSPKICFTKCLLSLIWMAKFQGSYTKWKEKWGYGYYCHFVQTRWVCTHFVQMLAGTGEVSDFEALQNSRDECFLLSITPLSQEEFFEFQKLLHDSLEKGNLLLRRFCSER